MPSWDEQHGRVGQPFDEWKLIDRDQRAFLRLGLEFATVEYDRLWEEAGEGPYHEDGPEQLDSFEDEVNGLWEHDYAWMHLSAVLRDAVSNFEVYLEKAREEVLRHQGHRMPVDKESPRRGPLKRFFCQLGAEIDTDEVKEVRDLRNFLTHRRGELRTEALRTQFQAAHNDTIQPWTVQLTKQRVLKAMDNLAEAVRQIDPTVYKYTWGRATFPNLRR